MRIAFSRAIAGAFWFATAVYCLLSDIPFASEQFLKPQLSPAIVAFAGWHAWISLAALGASAAMLAPQLRAGHRGSRAFIAAWAIVAVASFFAPPLWILPRGARATRSGSPAGRGPRTAQTRYPATLRPVRSRHSPSR